MLGVRGWLGRIGLRSPVDAPRAERVLATGRAFLATSALVAIYLDPTQPSRFAVLAYALLLTYLVHSYLVLLLVRARPDGAPRWSLAIHSADILWPVVITLFTEGASSPFFVLLVFPLVAAAYRWGLRETLATAGLAVTLLLVEGVLISSRLGPFEGLLEGELELNRLIMRSSYLLLMGFLLGYLAEEEKRLHQETSLITRLLGKAQAELGLRENFRLLLGELLRYGKGSRALLVLEEAKTRRVFLWEAHFLPEASETVLYASELDPPERDRYWFEAAEAFWCERTGASPADVPIALALDQQGNRVVERKTLPRRFLERHDARSIMGVSYSFRRQWSARLFVLDAASSLPRERELRFLQKMVHQVGPAVYNVFLLRRLRSQASAVERARVARELHDGIIQSLLAAEMEVEILLRRTPGRAESVSRPLQHVQQLLRREVVNLRELMEQMRPLELSDGKLLDFVAATLAKFQRETGISTRFHSELERVQLAPRQAHELGRIVQEALVNVRKHSGARNVLVSFSSEEGGWKLVIDDDGRGFPFAGRLHQAELDTSHRGPAIIKERVRAMGGELTLESTPGAGSRLEIALPRTPHA